ncbi:MAG: porin family protein [Myxococcales bacterium]|nr:porin family protein [Myxococcales bacterium]
MRGRRAATGGAAGRMTRGRRRLATSSSYRRRRSGWRAGCVGALALVFVAWPLVSSAQTPGIVSTDGPGDEAVWREAERAAVRAEEAAEAARAFADSLAPASEGGATRAADAESAGGGADRRALEQAVERAEAAAADARLAANAVERAERRSRRTSRSGPYLGGVVFYAAEQFDDSVIVKSSAGGGAFVGWRFEEFFAVEVRYEGFAGFDLQGRTSRGEIDGYAITANGRLYPMRGPIQPFLTVGVGGIRLRGESVRDSGARSRFVEDDVVLRGGAGVDLIVNEHLAVNLEAAWLGPGDDLSNLEMALFGGGLTYRF